MAEIQSNNRFGFKKKEAAAEILLDGKDIAQVYGFRRCGLGAINIIHT
jgi:hypothetical protein